MNNPHGACDARPVPHSDFGAHLALKAGGGDELAALQWRDLRPAFTQRHPGVNRLPDLVCQQRRLLNSDALVKDTGPHVRISL